MESLETVITIGASLIGGGGIAGVIGVWLSRKKKHAEGRSIEIKGELQIVDSALKVAETLREDLIRLTARVSELETRNDTLQAEIDGLERQLQTLKLENGQLRQENERLRAHG